MENNFIIISEYCQKSHTDPIFLLTLEKYGLIHIQTIKGQQYLLCSQLRDIERYIHLHYDLAINFEGIDAIRHMLQRIELLQQEVNQLRRFVKNNFPDSLQK